jgi:uncharacterized Zn finger protein
MNLFHHNKNVCDQCGEKFEIYDDLINHARHIHHHAIVKCNNCGKEFIHEKDRLPHKNEHKSGTKIRSPKEEVNERMKNFGDNF